jgi:N-acetylglucosamine kinase-like BadF-type ATPase
VTPALTVAVDGGNSKTDLALARASGEVLALVRGPQSSPHQVGIDGCASVLDELLAQALREAGLQRRNGGPVADVAQLLLAGVDFADEEESVRDAVAERRIASRVTVGNDTFAVLRAGTERGWGVAVVCGSGINCLGVAPDGRHARFRALGAITGDWGGGYDVGVAALSAAARSEDGRGPATTLERAVPAHFGLTTPAELAEAIHRRRVPMPRLTELPPVVFAEASVDAVAASLVERLAEEIATMATVALERLELTDERVEVLLGGGLIQSGDGRLVERVAAHVHGVAASALVEAVSSPPIVGAALLALDAVAADAAAGERLRRELEERFAEVTNGSERSRA